MIPHLPPLDAPPTPDPLRQAYEALTDVIAGHPGAATPCAFYAVVDDWVGPWGEDGYPIGFGLRYCRIFNADPRLRADPVTRKWVEDVTVLLQEELRDFLMRRFQAGTLPELTEAELREAAFDSHSRAYTRGGLLMVALRSPELIPVILTLPAAEYDPLDPDFLPTVKEVLDTLEELVAMTPETLALDGEARLTRLLTRLRERLDRGELNNLRWLDRLTGLLQRDVFQGRSAALQQLAAEVAALAERRKQDVARAHRRQTRILGALRDHFEHLMPGWWRLLVDDDDEAPPLHG